ncbi:MAG: aspartate--tRNA ligase [Thermoprotei archaeon]|nr:MAG: aspartate--tRNA ligase [Thermoprotei archaeon]
MKRTHTCGQLRAENAGQQVKLAGWVQHIRDFGGVLFVVLRDRYGETQITFMPENEEVFQLASTLHPQDVIGIEGTVVMRPQQARNPNMPTGDIEVVAEKLEIFSRAETSPFPIEDETTAMEDTLLRYRYLDLRRPVMQKNIYIRHKCMQAAREFLNANDFWEIEPPYLVKSTPEGARDFVVPSRNFPGKFYALPQSPQLYKQTFMVAGFDRYYHLARCFRDEDLRADRQPEFTQIDLEMSFVDPEDVMTLAEELLAHIMLKVKGYVLPLPLPRMSYDEAVRRFGTDKPDLRIKQEIHDITDIVPGCGFKVFEGAIESGGVVRVLPMPSADKFSRKKIDQLTKLAQEWGAKGLAFTKFDGEKFDGGIAKFLGEDFRRALAERLGEQLTPNTILFFGADKPDIVAKVLGGLRTMLAKELGIVDTSQHHALWIVNFPLFEENEDSPTGISPAHHPFTSPVEEDIPLLDENPLAVRANAYDLVLDGYEIAGGSIRIYDPALQKKIFELIGISPQEAEEKFGFLLESFRYGVPPHGGIAFGFDRLVMILAGAESIRDVIAYPKTTSGQSLMDGAPSEIDPKQLEELHIKIVDDKDR